MITTALAVSRSYVQQALVHWQLRRMGIRLDPSAMIKGSCQIFGDVTIGKNTVVQASLIDGRGGARLGNHVIFDQATIITAQHNLDSPAYETTYAPVHIDDYALIYMGALILPGRKVGRGAVVAAGAVVTRDVPEMMVVAGNPARSVRKRAACHTEANLRRMNGFVAHRLLEKLGVAGWIGP